MQAIPLVICVVIGFDKQLIQPKNSLQYTAYIKSLFRVNCNELIIYLSSESH